MAEGYQNKVKIEVLTISNVELSSNAHVWVSNVGDYDKHKIYSAVSNNSNVVPYFAHGTLAAQIYALNTTNTAQTCDIDVAILSE